MNSRLMRLLLKLYPRRIRNRYGDELLDLQSELTAQGDVSRTRLIWDMLAGALLVRPARRAHLMIGAVLVIGGLAVGVASIRGHGADPRARAAHPVARLAVKNIAAMPYGACYVGDGPSCSLTPCMEFIGQSPAEGTVANNTVQATRRRPRLAGTRCVVYPRVLRQRPVLVGD